MTSFTSCTVTEELRRVGGLIFCAYNGSCQVWICSSERLHDAEEWFSPPRPVMAWVSPLLCGLWREGWKMPRLTLFSLSFSLSFFRSMENKWNGHHFLSTIALRGHKMYPAVPLLCMKNSHHRHKLKTRSWQCFYEFRPLA